MKEIAVADQKIARFRQKRLAAHNSFLSYGCCFCHTGFRAKTGNRAFGVTITEEAAFPLIHFRILPVLLLATLPLLSKDSKKAYNEISTDTVALSGKAYIDPDSVKQLLGYDLGGHYMVIQMTVTPKGEKPLNVQLSDFQIFCEADGDRTQPQTAAEIAAADSLVLKRGQSGIGSLGEETGTTWSGVGFGGRSGKKKKEDDGPPSAAMKKGTKDDALKSVLTEKALPEKETTQPVSGLLYFPIEKKKLKDLVLFYTTPTGKLRLYFK
jgi:hypothetical protein